MMFLMDFTKARFSMFFGMPLCKSFTGLCLIVGLLSSNLLLAQSNERLRLRVEGLLVDTNAALYLPLYSAKWVQEFYLQFDYQPQWTQESGQLNEAGFALHQKIEQAGMLALSPNNYHLLRLNDLLAHNGNDPEGGRVSTELLLTDALFLLAYHMAFGKVDPATLQPKWRIDDAWARKLLMSGISITEGGVKKLLVEQEPQHLGYLALKRQLAKRLTLPSIPAPQPFQKSLYKMGESHDDVVLLRRILAALGYVAGDEASPLFDAELKRQIMVFQEQHGLEKDGSAGPFTLQALKENYYGDTSKIAINLERWRWLPRDLGRDHIAVNVANFELQYIREQQVFLTMKTVVGKSYRKTPLFSDVMSYMVLNPSWSVPHTIASEDILAKIKADNEYLQKNNMVLYQGWGEKQVVVDPTQIDWQNINTPKFPFHIRQQPSLSNALGLVKFIFPNEYDVYLHDTNDKRLFERSYRAFSSGCIRISKPLDLLFAIAEHNTRYKRVQIADLLTQGQEATVILSDPLPVHIQYWTAWVDGEDGEERLHYRADIYERDSATLLALNSSL